MSELLNGWEEDKWRGGRARALEQNRASNIKSNSWTSRLFMLDAFLAVFWNTATSLVSVIVPILALFLVFRLVHDLLWR